MRPIIGATTEKLTYEDEKKYDPNRRVFRGEVYYAKLPAGEEHEQTKLRPVVIIQNNIGNKYSPNIIVACISSTKTGRFANKPMPTQMEITLDKDSIIMCEHIQTISKTRLRERIGELTSKQIIQLDDCILKSLGLKWID